jgi:hypothetical protein
MKIWFDTEFYEDGRSIELISIGMVREDGETYYAETWEAHQLCQRSEWLMQNVQPRLGLDKFKARDEIAREIREFVDEKPEFWAYYADYDWVALCQLYGRMIDLPKGWPMYCRDVKQICDDLGNPEMPKQESAEHHALADAIWTKGVYEFLLKMQKKAVEYHRLNFGPYLP